MQKLVKDLRQVITYLRREKDILETRLGLSVQENERIKLQNEHLQRSLDEIRLTLEEVNFPSCKSNLIFL